MKVEEYAQMVANMRLAQKNYFNKRSQTNLLISKDLESQVDKQTERILNPSLF